MNKRERVRAEQINRIGGFAQTNVADFDQLSPVAKTKALGLIERLNDDTAGIVHRLEKFETGQTSGAADFHGGVTSKSVLRSALRADMRGFNETAAAIAEEQKQPGIMDGFRMPHGVSDESLANTARSFALHAQPLSTQFIELGHDADFMDQFRDRIEQFEGTKEDKAEGMETQTGSTAALSATIEEGLTVGKQLTVIMKNLYRNDAAKMAQWMTASHIQRVGVRKKNNATPPPPTNP